MTYPTLTQPLTNPMNKISTGEPSTLELYLAMCKIIFGSNSRATKYIEKKILEAPNGKEEEVLQTEDQMINLLLQIHKMDES